MTDAMLNEKGQQPYRPLVSVIVPVYKVEDLLARCVDSLRHQSYPDLEIILVEDGSPDRCPEMCDEFADQDSRVRVIHQRNAGLSAARNAGLDIATGEYITFVDSDDWVHPEYIMALVAACSQQPRTIACSAFVRAVDQLAVPAPTAGGRTLTFTDALAAMNTEVRLMTAWGKLYPAPLFDTIRFPIGRVHEDEFVVYKLYDRVEFVVMTDLALYYYWVREDSIMGTQRRNAQALGDKLAALEERASYLAEREYTTALAGLQKRRARQLIVAIRATRDRDMIPMHRAFRHDGLRLIRQVKLKGLGRHGAALLLFVALPRFGDIIVSAQRHIIKWRAPHDE